MYFCLFVKKVARRLRRTTQNFAPLREEFHTELKVAVRTCEGKAIHGIHRKVSTYLQVSARIFLSHEWALIYTNALRSVVVSRKVAKYRKVSATKICPYVLLSKNSVSFRVLCAHKSRRPFASLRERCSV